MEWTGARYADGPTVEMSTWVAAPTSRVWALRCAGADRAGAVDLVTDEMVLATTLIGTRAMVRSRLAVGRGG